MTTLKSSLMNVDMEELRATSDFRSIRLSWKLNVTPPIGFAVEYCELVTWGKDRCVTQIVNNSDIQLQTNLIEVGSPKLYEIVIGGLRIATNYSVDIQPLTTMDWPVTPFRGRSLNHNEIIVATKGFSVSPRSCLGDRSEIDVATGPYFGGKISVEGVEDDRCTWIGNPKDPRIIHTFIVDHKICGGTKKPDRMENVIIVTENQSIITHTARRFMVVCNLLPETYTIKASLHIPSDAENERNRHSEETSENALELERSQLLNYPYNKMISSKQTAELQQVAHLLENSQKETTTAHLVLMVILVVAAAIGVTTTVWWFIGDAHRKQKPTNNEMTLRSNVTDQSAADGQLIFVSHHDETEPVWDGDDPHTCPTTFVLAPTMNLAFKALGDSSC